MLAQRQQELLDYVNKTYSNVTVFIHDSWMRLDFNHDGNVGVDDLTLTLSKFYEFLKNYDYIEATTRIKSEIYAQAQKLYREQPAEG